MKTSSVYAFRYLTLALKATQEVNLQENFKDAWLLQGHINDKSQYTCHYAGHCESRYSGSGNCLNCRDVFLSDLVNFYIKSTNKKTTSYYIISQTLSNRTGGQNSSPSPLSRN